MPLDPQARALLDQVAAMGAPELHTLPVAQARQLLVAMAALQGPGAPVANVAERTIPGPDGPILLRLYTPATAAPRPVLVYLHGGGWVLGNLDTHDGACRAMANAAECLVVSVDYRLAPEHKFPAAVEDAYAATRWVAEHGSAIGADRNRIAVGGDSAGGNLAAAVTLMARSRGGPKLVHQLLVYPATDAPAETSSYGGNAEGYLLTRDAMLWFWNHYTRGPADRRNPYAAPLQAEDLHGLPPAHVITAEFDPLRDEGEAYAARLREAGVEVELRRYDGMIHGFFGMGSVFDQAKTAVQDAARALRAAFAQA